MQNETDEPLIARLKHLRDELETALASTNETIAYLEQKAICRWPNEPYEYHLTHPQLWKTKET